MQSVVACLTVKRQIPADRSLPGFALSKSKKNFLFETGLYQFTCDEEYCFSLVLQYKDSGDEYVQLHMDVVYPPSMKYEDFASSEWIEDINEFKQFVLASEEYRLLQTEAILKVDIYIEET